MGLLRAALWDGPYRGCLATLLRAGAPRGRPYMGLLRALWDGPYRGCLATLLRAGAPRGRPYMGFRLWGSPYLTDGLGNGFGLFLGHQGRDDAVVDGAVDGLFIREFDFRLSRMDVDVNRRRVDVEVEHGKGIARFRQHGMIGIVNGLEHQGIMDDAVIDDARLPVAVAL